MKAISLKQPWANMIRSGEKTIETRTWSTAYRGDLLICSSKIPNIPPAGYALAVVEVVDCRRMTEADEARACCEVYPGAWAWVLRNIRPITPFRVRGHQGFYKVELPEGISERENG